MNQSTMNATGNKKRPSDNEIAVRKSKLIRKDKWNSNQNRINCPQDNSKQAHAKKEHEKILDSIQPYLASLPDAQLRNPATSIASVVLSKAIERKARHESLSKNRDNPNFVPKPAAKFNFTLTSSKNIANKAEFKEIQSETAEKVEEFKLYLKKKKN